MIGVFVRFRYETAVDAQKIRAIAEGARSKFEGMEGLKLKAFTLNETGHEVTNFYIWESQDAANAFFVPETVARISALYGAPATVDFVELVALVEN